MQEAQKKKLVALVLERLVLPSVPVGLDGRMDRVYLGRALDLLGMEFDVVVRYRRRQGERYYNKHRPLHQRSGEARFKYDPAPKDNQGRIHLNLLNCYSYWEPKNQEHWTQVWIGLDKDMAMKMLVLGTLP